MNCSFTLLDKKGLYQGMLSYTKEGFFIDFQGLPFFIRKDHDGLIGQDPDARQDWGQEEKRAAEDEIVR